MPDMSMVAAALIALFLNELDETRPGVGPAPPAAMAEAAAPTRPPQPPAELGSGAGPR